MKRANVTFIDLYAGCGGLSLGLMKAGWRGLLAVEREANAFQSLSYNLIQGSRAQMTFDWPEWLPKEAISAELLLSKYRDQLNLLKGQVTLLAGGPPCQGFSVFGARFEKDPRNQAFRAYLKLVDVLRPQLVLIENVSGIALPFLSTNGKSKGSKPSRTYAELIISSLEKDYHVWADIIFALDYGVPQRRPRFIIIARLKGDAAKDNYPNPFEILEDGRRQFLEARKLKTPVTAKQAIGDLETEMVSLLPSEDSPRFREGRYRGARSTYQKLMHGRLNGARADSHRLANHRPDTVKYFESLLANENCVRNKKLRPEDRGEYRTRKHTQYLLSPSQPTPTVTTLPDDFLHYSEPRMLTVREMARLQSFPDWFKFKGKYTTGGAERTKECPRYTQVGNAVPPLLGEALGEALIQFMKKVTNAK